MKVISTAFASAVALILVSTIAATAPAAKPTTESGGDAARAKSDTKRAKPSSPGVKSVNTGGPEGFECDPKSCIDITAKIIDITITPSSYLVLPNGDSSKYVDWRDRVEREELEKVKQKYVVGGDPKSIEKHCEKCSCVKLFETDKEHPKKVNVPLKTVVRYYDSDGKLLPKEEGAAIKREYRATVVYEIYGYVGACHEDA